MRPPWNTEKSCYDHELKSNPDQELVFPDSVKIKKKIKFLTSQQNAMTLQLADGPYRRDSGAIERKPKMATIAPTAMRMPM